MRVSGVLFLSTALVVVSCARVQSAMLDIPQLAWHERSDWINVQTDVAPAAIGDGRVDDTAAIQAALDSGGDGMTVYLPPGAYRLTKTLVFRGPKVGCLMVGHGRDTRLIWDGPEGGCMFVSDGIAYSRYIGLSWDGRGKAAVGFDHAAEHRFETEVRHEHEALRNFTGFGIRVGNRQQVASAEILYRNCLFENCGTALAFLDFNDYDNTIDGCEFRHCGTGVLDNKGNFYARNCHFQQSREADFVVGSEHGSSIRRCTSVGSRRFVEQPGTIAPLTMQDCHISGWTDVEGAVHLNGSPVLMFDCSFTSPPSDRPPVKLVNPAQKLLLSNNRPEPLERLVQRAPAAEVHVIPPGRFGGVISSAEQQFLQDTAAVPQTVFDAVRDFGAKGDGQSDDTVALQAAIDAARRAGHGAIAYLPTGRYRVSQTLAVTGRDYTVGGSGFRCGLIWRGEAGQPMVEVSGVENVTLANLAVGGHDFGAMTHGDDIRITSPSDVPCRLVLDDISAYGMYQKEPEKHGIHFDRLPPESVVDAVHVQGNLRITGSDRASLLFRTSYEGTVIIEGAGIFEGAAITEGTGTSPTGLIGFLTRLATQSKPTLWVRDNRSVVMSDFYNEQSDRHLVFEGKPGQPEGAVTIQGPKMQMLTQEPVFDIRDYGGRIYYGQSQFYVDPKQPRFVAAGTRPCRLILAGHFWYNTQPRFELGPAVKLTLLGNSEIPDAGVDSGALVAIAAALDDLRQLGELDRRLSRIGQTQPEEDENRALHPEPGGLLQPLGPQMCSTVPRSPGEQQEAVNPATSPREQRTVAGWQMHLSRQLLEQDVDATARALELLKTQLDEIVRVVPQAAVTELQKVPLYFSPEHPGVGARAEYHPGAGWLRDNGRDPVMAKGVEFTNVRIFAAETRRMPNFALHELAHAYHDRVLAGGFANAEIDAAHKKAKASGKYDRVEQRFGDGRTANVRAYAMSDRMEYFAESTEAFFSRNDFYPFTKDELKQHDPEMFALLAKLWGAETEQESPQRKTAAPLQQSPVDFNHPPREYVAHELRGWPVLVEKQLADQSPELAKTALERLEAKLGDATAALPAAALPDLRKLKIFLMYGPKAAAGGRDNGLEYYRASAPHYYDWLDTRMGSSVVIYCAENYTQLSEFWALKALVHEFGHTQHLEHWPEDRADIYDTWDRAVKAGLYQVVREEDNDTYLPNYAAQNHIEYFAELTAMYFVGGNYFPKDRPGLKAYDPAGYALIQKLWGLGDDSTPPVAADSHASRRKMDQSPASPSAVTRQGDGSPIIIRPPTQTFVPSYFFGSKPG